MWKTACSIALLAASATLAFARPGGDAVSVGGDVVLDARVVGDAVLAGGSVRFAGSVDGSLYATGGKVTIDGQVARDARVAGGHAEIGPAGRIGGDLAIAGGQVTIRGPVKGSVQTAGGHVLIDAAVDGDVRSASGEVELGPNARIGGKLFYRSPNEVLRDPAAQVAGGIERRATYGWGRTAGGRHGGRAIAGWIWTATLVVLAAVFAAAFPSISRRVGDEMRARTASALLFGFIALVGIPGAAIVLMVTLIGLPLALLVSMLYLALLLVGYVAAAVTLGDVLLARLRPLAVARTGWRVAAAVLAMLTLALLGRIPFLGGVIAFAAMLAGIGAIVLAIRSAAMQTPPAAGPAS